MNPPDALRQVLVDRDDSWFREQYDQAVGRIEDRTADSRNPYFYSPTNEMSSYFGPVVLDDFGGEMTPETARKAAFELLALADLAPLTPESSEA